MEEAWWSPCLKFLPSHLSFHTNTATDSAKLMCTAGLLTIADLAVIDKYLLTQPRKSPCWRIVSTKQILESLCSEIRTPSCLGSFAGFLHQSIRFKRHSAGESTTNIQHCRINAKAQNGRPAASVLQQSAIDYGSKSSKLIIIYRSKWSMYI